MHRYFAGVEFLEQPSIEAEHGLSCWYWGWWIRWTGESTWFRLGRLVCRRRSLLRVVVRVLLSSVIRKLTMEMIGVVLIDILDTLSEMARALLFGVEQRLSHRVL